MALQQGLRDRVTVSQVEPGPARSPRRARLLSIVPGLGQLYYGARVRALQYFVGVVGCGGAAVFLVYHSFEIAAFPLGPAVRLLVLLLSELLMLTLLVSSISFWVAAAFDARQGVLARNAGRRHIHRWWFVKLREFLFEDVAIESEKKPHE